MLVYPGNLPPCNTNSYAGFNFSQTLHQVISQSVCTYPSASVILEFNENMLGCYCFLGHWFGRGHSALQLLGSARAGLFVGVAKVSWRGELSTLCDAICLEYLPGQKRC